MAIPSFDSQTCNFGLSDGTKYELYDLLSQGSIVPGPAQLGVRQIPNVTSGGSLVLPSASGLTGRLPSFCIVNDGTHRTWFHYATGAWVQDFQETTGTFLTETLLAVGGLSLPSGGSPDYFVQVNLQYLYVSAAAGCP